MPVPPPTVTETCKDCAVVMLDDAGETVTVGVVLIGATPVPVRVTTKGLPRALLDIARVPAFCPIAEGEKVTLIAHVSFGARLELQLFAWLKLLDAKKLNNCKAAPPVLPIVRIAGGLVVPMSWLLN